MSFQLTARLHASGGPPPAGWGGGWRGVEGDHTAVHRARAPCTSYIAAGFHVILGFANKWYRISWDLRTVGLAYCQPPGTHLRAPGWWQQFRQIPFIRGSTRARTLCLCEGAFFLYFFLFSFCSSSSTAAERQKTRNVEAKAERGNAPSVPCLPLTSLACVLPLRFTERERDACRGTRRHYSSDLAFGRIGRRYRKHMEIYGAHVAARELDRK